MIKFKFYDTSSMKQTKHPTGYLHCPMFTFTTLMIKLSVCEGNVKDDDFRLSKRNAALKCSVVELPVGA